MLFIKTSKIRESTIGSSFTVTYSAGPDPESLEELKALHSTYSSVNMSEFTIKPQTEPQTCANCKFDHEEWFEEACDSCCDAHSNWQPKTEPQTERSSE